MPRLLLAVCVTLLGTLPGGCAFSTTAKRWNDLVGPDDEPVYYTATTKFGVNLLVFVPFFGDLGVRGLVNDLTDSISEEGGDQVRIVQGDTENYWYGWPPLTWVVTPVVSTVAAEYRPAAGVWRDDREALELEEGYEAWYKPWTW